MDTLILNLLKVFCPYLKDMAKRTANPIDDVIVRILCGLIKDEDPVE